MNKIVNLIKNHPVTAYFLLAFGVEWLLVFTLVSITPPLVALLIGSWLPNLVGVIITGVAGGRQGLGDLFARVILWRIEPKWYVLAILIPVTIAFLAIGTSVLIGFQKPVFAAASQLPIILLAALFTGALGEELGWRGTALPRMQARWTPFISSLVLGILWGLYHIPSFLLSGLPLQNAPLIPFMLGAVGLTFIVTWTFNRTSGSLIPVFLYHFAFNTMLNVTGIPGNNAVFYYFGFVCISAAAVIVIMDWKRFTQPIAKDPGDAWIIQK